MRRLMFALAVGIGSWLLVVGIVLLGINADSHPWIITGILSFCIIAGASFLAWMDL